MRRTKNVLRYVIIQKVKRNSRDLSIFSSCRTQVACQNINVDKSNL